MFNTWSKPAKLCLTHDLNPLNFVGSLCKGKTMEPCNNIHLAPHFEECSPGVVKMFTRVLLWKLVVSSFLGTWLIRCFWFELATRDTAIVAKGESHYQWTTLFLKFVPCTSFLLMYHNGGPVGKRDVSRCWVDVSQNLSLNC